LFVAPVSTVITLSGGVPGIRCSLSHPDPLGFFKILLGRNPVLFDPPEKFESLRKYNS
jgi:hypothetical protein